MFDKIAETLSEQLNIDKSKITMESDILRDLGADSLDVVDLLMTLEDEMGKSIPDEQVASIKTIADLVHVLETL